MAHRATVELNRLEDVIDEELKRRQAVGCNDPASWDTLPFPFPDDYEFVTIQVVDLTTIRTSKYLASLKLNERAAR
eukprot:1323440-Alexandrium_andersonii.AAC.1